MSGENLPVLNMVISRKKVIPDRLNATEAQIFLVSHKIAGVTYWLINSLNALSSAKWQTQLPSILDAIGSRLKHVDFSDIRTSFFEGELPKLGLHSLEKRTISVQDKNSLSVFVDRFTLAPLAAKKACEIANIQLRQSNEPQHSQSTYWITDQWLESHRLSNVKAGKL